jgi:hypothetical protein
MMKSKITSKNTFKAEQMRQYGQANAGRKACLMNFVPKESLPGRKRSEESI